MKNRMPAGKLLTIAGHNRDVHNMELSKMKDILDWVNIMSCKSIHDFTLPHISNVAFQMIILVGGQVLPNIFLLYTFIQTLFAQGVLLALSVNTLPEGCHQSKL